MHYEAPLDADFAKGYYYLISPSGVTEIHPIRLAGSVRYHWNKDVTAIDGIDYFGSVVMTGKSADAQIGHGFVLFSQMPQSIESHPSRNLSGEFASAKSSFVFTLKTKNVSYLFVEWPEHQSCQIWYTLHPIENGQPSPKEIVYHGA